MTRRYGAGQGSVLPGAGVGPSETLIQGPLEAAAPTPEVQETVYRCPGCGLEWSSLIY